MLFGDSPSPGLVGIAKLAARGEVLEAKRVVQYFELESRSALNRTRPGMPFEWSLNPYRGCEFGCRYCYARYTHEFMELRASVDFEDRIYAKSRARRAAAARTEADRREQRDRDRNGNRSLSAGGAAIRTDAAKRWRCLPSRAAWRFRSRRSRIWWRAIFRS